MSLAQQFLRRSQNLSFHFISYVFLVLQRIPFFSISAYKRSFRTSSLVRNSFACRKITNTYDSENQTK